MKSRKQTSGVTDEDDRLIKRIAGKLMRRVSDHVDFKDLYQDGYIGLQDAYINWKPEGGATFETYAGIRIRGAMIDGLRRTQWQPRSFARKMRMVNKAKQEIESGLLREAKRKEVATHLKLTIEEYLNLVDLLNKKIIFQDLFCDGEENSHLGDDLSTNTYTLEEWLVLEEERHLLQRAVKILGQRELFVYKLHVGLDMSLREVGVILGVSESRICQISGKVKNKLVGEIRRLENVHVKKPCCQF